MSNDQEDNKPQEEKEVEASQPETSAPKAEGVQEAPEQVMGNESPTEEPAATPPNPTDGMRSAFVSGKVSDNPPTTNLYGSSALAEVVNKVAPNPEHNPVDAAIHYQMVASTGMHDGRKYSITSLKAGITGPEGPLGITRKKSILKAGAGVDDATILAIMSSAGLDGYYEAPLLSSGFRIQMRCSSAEDDVWLDEKLSEVITEAGVMSLGYSFRGEMALMRRQLVSFLARQMTGHNIAGLAQDDWQSVFKHISPQDYDTLLLLWAHSVNPDGWEVHVPCPNPKCHHVDSGKVVPAFLFWPDGSKLTEQQKSIITRTMDQKVTEEELVAYRADFRTPVPVDLKSGDVTFRIHTGFTSLVDDVRESSKWMSTINTVVNDTLAKLSPTNKTEEDIDLKVRTTRNILERHFLGMYISYITKIEMHHGDTVVEVEDKGKMNSILSKLINVEGAENLINTINDVMAEENPTFIGTPSITCPSCRVLPKEPLTTFNIETQLFTHALPGRALAAYIEKVAQSLD